MVEKLIARHKYPGLLESAAENFLINLFENPNQFLSADHLPDVIEAAMNIVAETNYCQPNLSGENIHLYIPASDAGLDSEEDDD